jgi:nicotinate-nucleotide adenylyltransferase
MRLGMVGGTFDPIHRGHVAMAEAGADCAGLDRVLMVPARTPPHRSAASAPAADRLQMCRIAVAGHPRLEVSDVELRRPGPSYTVDTLRDLRALWPAWELHLLLGWDAARDILSWREPAEVLRLAHLVVVSRPGLPVPGRADLARAGLDPDQVIVCDGGTPDVGATAIRGRLESGAGLDGLDGLLDPNVADYIRRRELYVTTHNAGS